MIRYSIYALLVCFALVACSKPAKVQQPAAPKEAAPPQPKPMMSAEQSAARLEALAERRALEFDVIYLDPTERLYMSRNRISHFKFANGKPTETIMKGVLGDFDRIEAYKDAVRKSGFVDYQVSEKAQNPEGPFFQLTIDGKTREAVLADIPDAKTKKAVESLIKEFKELARSSKAAMQ